MSKSCPLCLLDLPDGAAFCPSDGAALDALDALEVRDDVRDDVRGDVRHAIEGFEPRVTRHTGAILEGRFRIHGYVSKGATARVYLAEDLETNDVVAIKMFAPSVSQREAMRARFPAEAQALRAIDHPNVVRVIDAGEAGDGTPFLAMEALRGETLGDRLEREGRLPLDLALRVAREIAAGLSAAHRVGVVHRDVKPENVFLIGEPGAAPRVKLIDFGMARLERRLEEREAERRAHDAGLVLGTMQYMAPEQALGEPVDDRTDVYALGVLMFRAITGHLPFDAKPGTDLLGHQLFSPAPPPSWLDDALDPRVERVILSAMRKRPENRYVTMDALLRDLDREAPEGWPVVRAPDVYEPATDAGREAVDFVSARFRLPR